MQTGVLRVAVLLFALLLGGERSFAQQMMVADRGLPAPESPDRVRLHVVDRVGLPVAEVKVTGLAASWLYHSPFRAAPFRTTPVGPLWTNDAGIAEFDAPPGRIVSVLLERTRYAPRVVYPLRPGSAYTVTLELGRTLQVGLRPEVLGGGDLDASVAWSTFNTAPDPIGVTLPVLRAGSSPVGFFVPYLPAGSLTFSLRNSEGRVSGRHFSVPEAHGREAFGSSVWDIEEWSRGLVREWRFLGEDGLPLEQLRLVTDPVSLPSMAPVHFVGGVLRVGPIAENLAWAVAVEAPEFHAWTHFHQGRTTGIFADVGASGPLDVVLARRARVHVRVGPNALARVPEAARLYTFSGLRQASSWQELARESLAGRVLDLPDFGRVFAVACVEDRPVGYLVHQDGDASYLEAARLTIVYTVGGVAPRNVVTHFRPSPRPSVQRDPSEVFFSQFIGISDEGGVLEMHGLLPTELYAEPHFHQADFGQATLHVSLQPGEHLTVRRDIRANVQRLVRFVDATDGTRIGTGMVSLASAHGDLYAPEFGVDAQGEALIGGLAKERVYTLHYAPSGPASVVGPWSAPWYAPRSAKLDPLEEGALVVRVERTQHHPHFQPSPQSPEEP